MSRTSGKQIIYKLYDVDNVFIRVLDEVSSNFSTEKNIFSGSAPMSLTFSKKVDELPADITFNNKIKIYIRNKWNSEPELVYYGYIVSIEPSLSDDSETTGVSCLGAISKLQNDYLRIDDEDLAYEIAPNSIGTHINTILTHYRTTINNTHGSTNRSMIDNPTSYWSDTDYIEETSTIGEIPQRYFNSKHLSAINEICKFLPKNDSVDQYWYWYLNDEGRFILKKLSSTADHTLIIGKHCTFSMRNNIESVVNRVYFWNERGDYAGERVRTRYEDTTSQDQFDVISDQISDSNVTTYTQSRLLAEGSLMDRKDNEHQVTLHVSESQYNVLSFKPGQVVKLLNIKDENMFSSRMIIVKVVIQEDSATLSLSTPRPDLTTQVETDREFVDKQLKWFGEIMTRIDGSRIYSGIQHWTSEGIKFNTDGYNKITWTGGSFILPSDVRRVVIGGEITGMTASTDYFLYLDEENSWCTKDTGKAAVASGTGSINKGENFLIDSGASWTTDQYKGYVLYVNPAVGDPVQYIITRNTTTVLYIEGHNVFREDDDVAAYEIHKLELRISTGISGEGTSTDGSTTTLVDTSRTEADDYWNGFKIKILSGSNAGIIRTISNYASTTKTFTFPALPFAITTGVEYSLYLSSETQILIGYAKPSTSGGEAVIVPDIPTMYPEYQAEGSTYAYLGLNDLGQLIKDVINTKLNTDAETILADFDFGSTNYAGAVKAGNISWNTSTGGSITGSGVALYRKGIVGAKNGTVTFSIDSTTGDATFAGTLSAGISIVSPIITGAEITGGIFLTNASGQRVEVGAGTYGEEIRFYSSLYHVGTIAQLGHNDLSFFAARSSADISIIAGTTSGTSVFLGASGYGDALEVTTGGRVIAQYYLQIPVGTNKY